MATLAGRTFRGSRECPEGPSEGHHLTDLVICQVPGHPDISCVFSHRVPTSTSPFSPALLYVALCTFYGPFKRTLSFSGVLGASARLFLWSHYTFITTYHPRSSA